MRLYFARHGESEANVLKIFANTPGKYGLTDKGRQQACALAERLKPEGITRVFASPLLRAQQTAQIVCEELGTSFDTHYALCEFSVGDHEGSCCAEAWDEYHEVEEAWLLEGKTQARIGGGECFDDIEARFVPFVTGLVEEFGETDERILVVAHGGIFSCMLPVLFDNLDRHHALENRIMNAMPIVAEVRNGRLHGVSWNGEPLA